MMTESVTDVDVTIKRVRRFLDEQFPGFDFCVRVSQDEIVANYVDGPSPERVRADIEEGIGVPVDVYRMPSPDVSHAVNRFFGYDVSNEDLARIDLSNVQMIQLLSSLAP